ncbi:nucleoside recognition domain-containing protein [Beggiatoa leptomitoformis]|uniref:Nucleoside recognition family protein n=1 Tax=Beggiatoa leptomitoformis TaxID=288004 RepID=A0A2N9YAS2_9GAMM|nr:nucleoside recognition domain-containing protein [Beggiatoa leptomitoformis]ALG67044.1 nucleoside recognition family protein [Beggiatoa leptomitoformis]AUI67577.1 nucleoside recognition family protein [Beggiatoa leptomitoformis]
MEEIAALILKSGRAGVELALFVLLPVMVVMLTLMRLLEAENILDRIVNWITPIFRPLGIPGLGIFALIQTLFVSFAAPLATLAMMDKSGTSRRHIAATLAMVFTVAQANVTFPMATLGLHVGTTILVSLIAGLLSATVTYHVFARHLPNESEPPEPALNHPQAANVKGVLHVINRAGREAFEIAIASIPMLILALLLVNSLQAIGIMGWLETLLAPVFAWFNYPSASVLLIITKYIAGGTAMMGVSADALQHGTITIVEFNRMAGLLISPFDVAGVAILISAGPHVASVLKPAAYGAIVGTLIKMILHGLLF